MPCRYLAFLQEELSSVLYRKTLIEVLDGNHYPYCLALKGLESIFGYNFSGTTDVLLAYSEAVKVNMPEIGSVAAFELRKGPVNPSLKRCKRTSVKPHGFADMDFACHAVHHELLYPKLAMRDTPFLLDV